MRLLFEKWAKIYPKSLVSEFCRMFGPANTEKLLAVFAGTTLQIPSTKDLENAERDILIWETLRHSKSPNESRKLSANLASQYHLPRKKIRHVYYTMMRRMRENKTLEDADRATGQHKQGNLKLNRRVRIRL